MLSTNFDPATFLQTFEELWSSISSAWQPPPRLSLSEWADEHARLELGKPLPGRWKTRPYQREILDSITDPDVEVVIWKKSARVGYTKCLMWAVGYTIDVNPGSILIVQPTVDEAEAFSKEDLQPSLEMIPALTDKLGSPKSRDSSNTIKKKHFPGGVITLVGANAGTGFRRIEVRLVLLDEVDAYPPSAGEDGDQVRLAWMRASTYTDRKLVMGSTPLAKGASRIEQWFQVTDQRYRYVPCPHCGEYQRLEWENFHWERGRPETVHFACIHNGCEIRYEHQRWMDERGEWRSTATGRPRYRGYDIWAAYSEHPGAAWPVIASDWEDAEGDPEAERTFVNTVLGRSYQPRGEAPDEIILESRQGDYRLGDLPGAVQALTAGIDVQKRGLYWSIRGWAAKGTSYLLDCGYYVGNTRDEYDPVWQQMADRLTQGVAGIAVKRAAIDSGYHTDAVYAFARQHRARVIATKGKDHLARRPRPIQDGDKVQTAAKPYTTTLVDCTVAGKLFRGGVKLWTFDTDTFKTWVHDHLEIDNDAPGAWHLPADAPEDYLDQLLSEERMQDSKGQGVWIPIKTNNHYFDTETLAVLAAHTAGLHQLGQPKRRAAPSAPSELTEQPPAPPRRPDPWTRNDR